MNEPVYPYKKSEDVLIFDFESLRDGEKSRKKIVFSSLEDAPELYSLSLFEVLENETLDVRFQSRNNDLIRVLATILEVISDFFGNYPNKKVIFTGSTASRTRLYRIIIANLHNHIESKFKIEGLTEGGLFEEFRQNQSYEAYVISLKFESDDNRS